MHPRKARHKFHVGMFLGLRIIWPILSMLLGLMMVAGVFVGALEGWSIQDSIYFAFVSGLTIGYGDLAPTMLLTRILAIGIGICGVVFTALLAAVAVGALAAAFKDEFPRPGALRADTETQRRERSTSSTG